MDINIGDPYRLKLTLWDDRDFSGDALVIDIPSSGIAQASGGRTGKPNIWPRIIEDDNVDTLTISLNRAFIGNRYRLDVSTYTTDPNTLADEELAIRSDGQPPAHQASLLVAFRDAFPAATPAQALRRWAGAHTGPLGDRHGLKYVLDGARQSHIPVVLLDLKDPASLAALDFMGNLQAIQDLSGRGLLILPDVAIGEPAQTALDLNRATVAGFGLPKSPFVYAGSSSQARIPGFRAQFVQLTDGNHVAISGGTRLIPLPFNSPMEATADGPSLEVRRILIDAASASDPAEYWVAACPTPPGVTRIWPRLHLNGSHPTLGYGL